MNIVYEKLDRVRKLRLEMEIIDEELKALHQFIVDNCEHPEFAWKHKRNYIPGGYYDRSETTTWEECSICGKKRNIQTKYGTYG